jgi:parallel beta-helix repeat protein
VLDNTFGPAGTPADVADGEWADGISLACGNSLVEGNVVQDATDGAIVVFGAPGPTIKNNTVIARTSELLGAINMVDFAPVHGNYVSTVVSDNMINAQGALIKVAIAMGPQVWGCGAGTNHGGAVTGNTLTGTHMGYGLAVNGVTAWTVTGNVDNSQHVGIPGGGCGTSPSPPAGFQYEKASNSTLQPQFQPGQLDGVLGLHS